MVKQAYALIRALKEFIVYILHSHITAYVPSAAIKEILTRLDPNGRRAKWIVVLLEYDLEIQPTKIIKGQGLAKLMTQSNYDALEINMLEVDLTFVSGFDQVEVCPNFMASLCYKGIIHVIQHLQAPSGSSQTQARSLKLKVAKFCIIDRYLYWRDPGGVLLNCLLEEEAKEKMQEFHEGDCGDPLYWKTTAHKILRDGFCWPTLFADIHKEVSSCHECHIFEGKRKLMPLPLKPISIEAHQGLDFIREINPASSGQHKWILKATDYFTKWIEVVPTRQAIDAVIIEFLINNILSRFGCPRRIITDNAKAFTSSKLVKFCNDYNIILSHSTAYYPQGNGLAKASNKNLVRIIKKLLQDNKKAWHVQLKFFFWADRVSTKKSIGTSPFQLVYSTDVVFPASLGAPVMKFLQEQEAEPKPMQSKINQLVEMQQVREGILDKTQIFQSKMKNIFDKRVKDDDFQLGDPVLKWESRFENKGKQGKFDHLWQGPFKIYALSGKNVYFLSDLNGKEVASSPVNGRFLKHYLT